MKFKKFPEKSLKVTAMLYAIRREVVEHVRRTGHLPEKINTAGFPTAFGVLTRRRGHDPVLSKDEQLVFDALVRDKRTPGGMANVIDELDLDD